MGVERMVECVGLGVGVDANIAEIGAEGGFHLCPHRAVQRMPTTALVMNRLLYLRGHLGFAVGLCG